MYLFIYKTTHTNGKYYIGKHETKRLNDGYLGSGKWVRSIKDRSTLFREVIAEASSTEELRVLEEYHISIHYDDPLCMNMKLASIGRTSEDGFKLAKKGTDHPDYNPTIYHLVHKDGIEFTGTQYEFWSLYHLDRGKISLLVNGHRKYHMGWRVFGVCTDKKKRVVNTGRLPKPEVHTFIHTDGTIFTGTQNELLKRYSLHSGALSQMIKRSPKVNSVKGWKIL
jgi:hypothetical protein